MFEINKVTKDYPSVRALDNVSLRIGDQEMVSIRGESGCGKSTLLHIIAGLVTADSGTVTKNDVPLPDVPHKRGVAMVFQDSLSSLDPLFTCADQIMESILIHRKISRAKARAEAVEMLRLVGIPDPERRMDQYPHELSGGQRQRVMIACALACRPKLLIADEPTTALDVTIQSQILDLIVDLNRKLDMAVILITHDLSVVAETCSRVIVMYLGQIVEEADVISLFETPLHPYTISLLSAVPMPDPVVERTRKHIVYDPSKLDQSGEKREMREVRPGHFVFSTTKEFEGYRQKMNQLEEEAN